MAKQFQGKKLGVLADEASDLLASVSDVKDAPRLEPYITKEVDPVRALFAFLVVLEKLGTSVDPRALAADRRSVMARGTALVGQWMLARANAATRDIEQRLHGIPLRFFELKRGKESRRIEGRLTEATMEALRVVNGLYGVLEALGADHVKRAVAALRGPDRAAPSWPPTDDRSGGAVQHYVQLKAVMAAHPDLFWLWGGALDDVAQATLARQEAQAYTVPITWGPTAT